MSTGPRCRELGLCEPVGNREDGYARQRELLMGMMELTGVNKRLIDSTYVVLLLLLLLHHWWIDNNLVSNTFVTV